MPPPPPTNSQFSATTYSLLRFPPPFFATQKAAVEAAGYEAGEGFIKLPYDRDLPTGLLTALTRARVEEYETTGAGWNDR